MLVTSIFSFSKNVFFPSLDKFQIFNCICRLQMLSIWTSLKFCRLVKSQAALTVQSYLLLTLSIKNNLPLGALNTRITADLFQPFPKR